MKIFRTALLTAAILAAASLTVGAFASPVTYYVTDGVTANGNTFTGSYTIQSNGTFTGGSFTLDVGGIDTVFGFNQLIPGGNIGGITEGLFGPGSAAFDFKVLDSNFADICTSNALCVRNDDPGDEGSDFEGGSGDDVLSATASLTPPGSPALTPEPSSLLLLGTGALGMLGAAHRRFFRA